MGLGRACGLDLSRDGVPAALVERGGDALREAAREFRQCTGSDVRCVACDITTERGREAALIALPAPAILVTNAGGRPPGDFCEWDRKQWIGAVDANILAPLAPIPAAIDTTTRQRSGRAAFFNCTEHPTISTTSARTASSSMKFFGMATQQ